MRTNSILIVDDDEKLCALLRSYFEQEQFIVYVAHDGTEALNICAAKSRRSCCSI